MGECQELPDKTGRIFIYTNKLLNRKDYTSKIMTKGSTGNIINHLAVMYQIFKNTPLPTRSTNQDESFTTITKNKPFAETIEKLEESQYSTISYVYHAIQKIKSRLSCSFDPINENND
ncbi:26287_t:CDS:2, partial [Racocetra persica]